MWKLERLLAFSSFLEKAGLHSGSGSMSESGSKKAQFDLDSDTDPDPDLFGWTPVHSLLLDWVRSRKLQLWQLRYKQRRAHQAA
jgi:hypothetical protein